MPLQSAQIKPGPLFALFAPIPAHKQTPRGTQSRGLFRTGSTWGTSLCSKPAPVGGPGSPVAEGRGGAAGVGGAVGLGVSSVDGPGAGTPDGSGPGGRVGVGATDGAAVGPELGGGVGRGAGAASGVLGGSGVG